MRQWKFWTIVLCHQVSSVSLELYTPELPTWDWLGRSNRKHTSYTKLHHLWYSQSLSSTSRSAQVKHIGILPSSDEHCAVWCFDTWVFSKRVRAARALAWTTKPPGNIHERFGTCGRTPSYFNLHLSRRHVTRNYFLTTEQKPVESRVFQISSLWHHYRQPSCQDLYAQVLQFQRGVRQGHTKDYG